MIRRTCEQCGQELNTNQKRFCSRACKEKHQSGGNSFWWKGGKITQVCEFCGKEYDAYPSRVEQRFCSKTCYGKWKSEYVTGENNLNWRGGKITRVCECCGKEFKEKPYRVEKGYGKFCSAICRVKSMRGEDSPAWRGGKIARVCKYCGREFEVLPSAVKHGGGKFCSVVCHDKYQIGKKHPGWKGGKSFEPYGLEFNNTLKRAIRERDNYTCAISGEPARCVHHISYDKTDNRPENLITLNRASHSKTNTNREHWETVLSSIAIARTNKVVVCEQQLDLEVEYHER